MYSRFANALNKSNVKLDRQMLANLAQNEPLAFKSVLDEIVTQADPEMMKVKQRQLAFDEAINQGYIGYGHKGQTDFEEKTPKLRMFGLRFPEKDAKTDKDYLRTTFKEEDQQAIKDFKYKHLTPKEQKRYPRDVLDDDWEEDESLVEFKKHQK